MSDDSSLNSKECTNLYELIMVAAKEARRLNDFYRNRNMQPKELVTTEAIRRAKKEGIRYTLRTPEPTPKKSEAT